VKTYFRKLR